MVDHAASASGELGSPVHAVHRGADRAAASGTAGPIGLHGGGEFRTGDEPFLRALVEAARRAARAAAGPVRIAIVPTAAAGERPEMAVAFGARAFAAAAAAPPIAVDVEGVYVLDAATAADEAVAARLADAHLVYLPGGDPGLVVAVLAGSRAWAAVLRANSVGAVVAGASAGAMALAAWTWTPAGGAPGLGLVPGVVVVPHAARVGRTGWRGTFAERAPGAGGAQEAGGGASVGIGTGEGGAPGAGSALAPLGLEERTGILSDPATGTWRVHGPGRAFLSSSVAEPPVAYAAGSVLVLPGSGDA